MLIGTSAPNIWRHCLHAVRCWKTMSYSGMAWLSAQRAKPAFLFCNIAGTEARRYLSCGPQRRLSVLAVVNSRDIAGQTQNCNFAGKARKSASRHGKPPMKIRQKNGVRVLVVLEIKPPQIMRSVDNFCPAWINR